MTPEEWRLKEASRWLAVAARDLKSARLLVSEEPSGSAFFSQQAAEKAAKAFLNAHNIEFRRTHDLEELARQCVPLAPGLAGVFGGCRGLTDYAVVFRYLDAPREPDVAEAADALARATALYDAIKAELKLS